MDNQNKLAKVNNNTVGKNSLKAIVDNEKTQKKFKDLLGKKSQGFLVSLLNTVGGNTQLQQADAMSVLKAGAVAATLDLPIDPNLGFSYIVPYNSRGKNEAQFQMGYKGFIQLAIRSAQYRKINVAELYEGQFISYDPITDTLEYDINNKISDTVTHYIAYFKTVNGFDKYNVMSKDEIINHAKKFSKTYSSKYSPWVTNFESMAKKTVLKLLLSKFGILSIEMQIAQKADQAVIEEIDGDNIEVEYVDGNENIDATTTAIEVETVTETIEDDEELTSENLF